MTNYILSYKFEDYEEATHFLYLLKKKYPVHIYEMRHGIPYFAFSSRTLAGVKDNIISLIDQLTISDLDYAAIYYLRKGNPETINRLMIIGHNDLAQDHLADISKAEHENLLSDLFDVDFVKLRLQQHAPAK